MASSDYLERVDSLTRSSINLTKRSSVMEVTGTGSHGDWSDVKICPESRKNICSTSRLQSMGYGVMLFDKVEIVRLDTREVVLTGQLVRGMPCILLDELWSLKNLSSEINSLSHKVDIDELELLHDRSGHFNHGALIEGHKRMLFTGSGLKPKHLRQKIKKCLCGWCARAKITRVSFQPRDEPSSTIFGEFIVTDIAVYLNCPSIEGVKYVLQFTCVATKWFYSYGLTNRTGDEVIRCLRDLVEVQIIKFPGEHKVRRYHADGGKELIDQRVVQYIELNGGKVTFSSTDTPELNGIAERKYRTAGEMTLTMLIRSGLPKGFWWRAYLAARYTLLRLPTRTCKVICHLLNVFLGVLFQVKRSSEYGGVKLMFLSLEIHDVKTGRTRLGPVTLSVTPRLRLGGLSIYLNRKKRRHLCMYCLMREYPHDLRSTSQR